MFTIDDLMPLLVAKAGLPYRTAPTIPSKTFADWGWTRSLSSSCRRSCRACTASSCPTTAPLGSRHTFGEIVCDDRTSASGARPGSRVAHERPDRSATSTTRC